MAEETSPKKKAAHRSPNYPVFALSEALDKVRVIYDEEKRTATTPAVIAKHLGYAHTDGPGGRALSCLRQYGLLEQVAGDWKVSDLAFNILHLPDGNSERANLLKDAACKPNLFRQLREDYPNTIPSDATLQANLVKRDFNPDSVSWVIGNFRATMEFAKVYDGLHNEGEDESKMQTPPTATPETPAADALKRHPTISLNSPGSKSYEYGFEGAGCAVLTLYGSYTADDLDDLEESIKTSLKTLRRSVKKETVQ